VLSIRSLCSLPTTVCVATNSIVNQITLLPSNNSLQHSKQYLLYVRLRCSLSTLIVCTAVSQVILLSSYNSKAIVSSLCSLAVPIYLNFSWIYLHFWMRRERMLTNTLQALAKHWVSRHHSHIWSHIHNKRGFHLGLWPIQNPLLILCYWDCAEVSPLCSLPTTFCVTVSSVVYQVALLPSNNGLCSCR